MQGLTSMQKVITNILKDHFSLYFMSPVLSMVKFSAFRGQSSEEEEAFQMFKNVQSDQWGLFRDSFDTIFHENVFLDYNHLLKVA